MKTNPFESSANKVKQEVEKITKESLQASLEALKEPYIEFTEALQRANRLGSNFSDRQVTSEIQKITDELAEISQDSSEEKLISLGEKIKEVANEMRTQKILAQAEAQL
jgi:hypothetical protein